MPDGPLRGPASAAVRPTLRAWHPLASRAGAAWLGAARARFRRRARELQPAERDALAGFFDPAVLDQARVFRLEPQGRPLAAELLRSPDVALPLELARMGGITLADTIVAARRAPTDAPTWLRFLFHELVHVVQFDILGVERFVARYLEEWARAGYRYRGIALEEMAYRLDARYAANPHAPFDVRPLVELALATPEPPPPPPPATTADR